MIDIDLHACMRANQDTIATLTQTVAELRAERERLRDALQFYAHGHHFGTTDTSEPGCICLENGEIARDALASPPARNDPAEAEKIHQEGLALADLFRQIQSPPVAGDAT